MVLQQFDIDIYPDHTFWPLENEQSWPSKLTKQNVADFPTNGCSRKLGSMVTKWVVTYTYRWSPLGLSYNPLINHLLTFWKNIQVVLDSPGAWAEYSWTAGAVNVGIYQPTRENKRFPRRE